MAEKLFSFRWDIDHRACITDGLEPIRQVCRELGVPNSFYVNMGRSTNLAEWVRGIARTKEKLGDMNAVNLIGKIGWGRFAVETVLARPVGASFMDRLQRLQDDGHELGLHGGMDHVVWSRRFSEIPKETLRADIARSCELFERYLGKPAGFCSPGFRSDDRLLEIVEEMGFQHCGDAREGEPHRAVVNGETLNHWIVPVTLIAPHTVPFLEYHGARGTGEDAVLAEIDQHLEERDQVVLYGHPCYEGVRAGMLRRVFHHVLDRGYRFVTQEQLVEKLIAKGGSSS